MSKEYLKWEKVETGVINGSDLSTLTNLLFNGKRRELKERRES